MVIRGLCGLTAPTIDKKRYSAGYKAESYLLLAQWIFFCIDSWTHKSIWCNDFKWEEVKYHSLAIWKLCFPSVTEIIFLFVCALEQFVRRSNFNIRFFLAEHMSTGSLLDWISCTMPIMCSTSHHFWSLNCMYAKGCPTWDASRRWSLRCLGWGKQPLPWIRCWHCERYLRCSLRLHRIITSFFSLLFLPNISQVTVFFSHPLFAQTH